MTIITRITTAALVAALTVTHVGARPAAADGAASTRNILFGAAAVGGTLLIINHNKKVHQKYAEYDRRQAETAAQRDNAQAAYASERAAYIDEKDLVNDLQRELAYQHGVLKAKDREIASLTRSLLVAKYGAARIPAASSARVASTPRSSARDARRVSYGWGSF